MPGGEGLLFPRPTSGSAGLLSSGTDVLTSAGSSDFGAFCVTSSGNGGLGVVTSSGTCGFGVMTSSGD